MVVIHVDDTRLGSDVLRDLMGVVGGPEAGADIEELPDALTGQRTRPRAAERPGSRARREGCPG